jgi:FkbM family methyltransferase
LFHGAWIRTHVLDQEVHLAGALTSPSEVRLTRYLIRHLRAPAVFFDVGAHHGYYALLACCLLGDGGSIHAFEPAAPHFRLLQKNLAGLPGAAANRLALYSREGTLRFYENLKGASTVDRSRLAGDPAAARESFKETEVPAATLDGYCSRNAVWPDFIKLDVEGAESDVLEGGALALARKPRIVMEVWRPPLDNTPHLKAIALLRELGYRSFRLDESGDPLPLAELDPARDIPPSEASDNFLFQSTDR